MDIPIEVMRYVITQFLEIKEVGVLSRVCQRWKLLMDKETAVMVLTRDFNETEGDWKTYKTLRDKHVDYSVWEEYEDRINMRFESKNIKGYVGVRGTRVWFSQRVMTRYVNEKFPTCPEECKFTTYEENYPDECFAFSFSSMKKFLGVWIHKKGDHNGFNGFFTTDFSLAVEDFDRFFQYLLSDMPKVGLFLREDGIGCDNISIIHDYDKIINELTEILTIAKKKNVTFFWV